MPGFNQIVLLGKLVAEPELKYHSSLPVCKMRLLVPNFYKGKDGEQKNNSLFIDVMVWRRMAEICANLLHRNSQIMVSGRLEMNEWEGKDGKKRTTYRVQSQRIQFLDPRENGAPAPEEAEAA